MAKTITNKTIGIFGPGAIGGFLAGALWKAGCDVAVIARPDTALRLNAEGICLKTKLLGDFIARPTVVERMASAPALLIVAVKANDLASALPHIHSAVGEQTLIIPFQNGIEHIALLKKEFGERVIVGMIGNIVAEKEKGGCIVSPSASVTIELGSEDVPQEKLQEVVGLFEKAGIAVSVRSSEAEVIWRKFARLAPLAAVTAASGKILGEIRKDPQWRSHLIDCVEEAARVAAHEGVSVSSKDVLEQIEKFPDSLTTSLARDVARGEEGELDAILGAVIRKADKYGLARRTFDELLSLIQRRLKS